MLKIHFILLLFIILSVNFFYSPSTETASSQKVTQLFRKKLKNTIDRLANMQAIPYTSENVQALQHAFLEARSAYKQAECLTEYYYPSLSRRINGAPLPSAEGENSFAALEPEGFQVIEEALFDRFDKKKAADISEKILLLKQIFTGILEQKDPYGFQDKYIFDAITLEMYRLTALGITGFDSQFAYNSVGEAAAVIASLKELIATYLPSLKDPLTEKKLNPLLDSAKDYLMHHPDFDRFNRLYFITVYADPISEKILQLKKALQFLIPGERRILSPLAPHLFATDYYSPSGYSPDVSSDANAAKILLGEKLFYDNNLSANRQRSCATCHQPGRAFTDGLPKSLSLDNVHPVSRNAPTLWNAAFQRSQFYDSRVVFIEEQVFTVLHNNEEMGSSLQLVRQRITQDTSYTGQFNSVYAYSVEPLSEENIANAIASYLRSLQSLHSRFDKFMNGDKAALNENERRGFNLYMGKAKCATCHFAPLFNGVAPPYFNEAESEVLGVPSTTDTAHAILDPDPGKYNLYPIEVFRYAFKTPTLRNIGLTAPYMHNGVYKTLEEVIDFYNKGGGAGLGIAPTNQTLPASPLKLSNPEKKQLIAFLFTLTDTIRNSKYVSK